MTERADAPEALNAQIRDAINAHGDAFAAAVNRRVDGSKSRHGVWRFRAAEFAGELRNTVLHIDGVAECELRGVERVVFAALESKRVAPKFAKWCFLTDSVMRNDMTARRPLLDLHKFVSPVSEEDGDGFWAMASGLHTNARVYSRALVLSTRAKSTSDADGRDRGRKGIDEAVTQACRGAGILINVIRGWSLPEDGAVVVPLVVTTAELLRCDTEISNADLVTGRLTEDVSVSRVNWLWYETHLSPALAPTANRVYGRGYAEDRIGHLLDHHQARAVMIANATHLPDALAEIAEAVSIMLPAR